MTIKMVIVPRDSGFNNNEKLNSAIKEIRSERCKNNYRTFK